MGITAFKFVIKGGKSAILQLEISFSRSKTANLPSQMTNLNAVIL